jgi:hypothetical protein
MRKFINYLNSIEGTMYVVAITLCFWVAALDILLITYVLTSWFLK